MSIKYIQLLGIKCANLIILQKIKLIQGYFTFLSNFLKRLNYNLIKGRISSTP